MKKNILDFVVYFIFAVSSFGATLTPEEVQQYVDDLGVVLTTNEQQQIAALVKPDVAPQWRIDAEARIEQCRKADLAVQVVDANGLPLESAQVDVKLKDHDFRFSGVLRVKDLTDADGKLQGISTNRFQELFTKLYNGAGLNNGFKPKLRNGHEAYLPGFLSWAESIDMPVRGHALIWPGGSHMTPTVLEKVEALETLWDNVYLSKQYSNTATNDTVATVDALAGDTVVVLVSSNVGGEPLETNVTFSGSATLASSQFDRAKGNGPSVAYWISDVQSDGTVQVDLAKGSVYQSVVVYHLRPDGGAISLLDTAKSSQTGIFGLTNAYSFAGASRGILLEGASTYATSTEPLSAEWVLVNSKRKAAHFYFSNVSALESIWTNSDSGNMACYGLAFANARVVGEQEAFLAEPVLQQELKDQIQTEMIEWASKWSVYEWDVINETRGNHRIQDLIGWDQMAEWFKIASSNTVQPGCDLMLNEYGVISAEPSSVDPAAFTSRRDTMMGHLDIIQTNGGPLSRIGFQSRMTRGHLDPDEIYTRLDEFGNRYGLPMVGTEFEVRGKDAWPVDETLRGQITEETLTSYFSHPLVAGLTAWTYMHDEDWAMCEYDGTVKLNGLVWYYLHHIRYITDETRISDAAGNTSVRGFKGDYEITVSYGGATYPIKTTLLSNQTVVITLDDVTLTTPSSLYTDWTAEQGFGSNTNLLDDANGDGVNNLVDYAIGGAANLPVESTDGSYLQYVHVQWDATNATARGLSYEVEANADLTDAGGWSTVGVELVGNVDGVPSAGYTTVTNRVLLDETAEFVRLNITFTP